MKTTESKIKPLNVAKANIKQLKDAVEKGRPLSGVTDFLTHDWPHLDEIAAWTLLYIYGEQRFPGIKENFRLGSISNRNLREAGYGKDTWYELLCQGYLTTGIGGGPLDDHQSEDGRQEKDGSATERIAKFLGIETKSEIQNLLRYVNYEDNNGDNPSLTGSGGKTGRSAQRFMLATTIKTMWRVLRETGQEKEMTRWTGTFMEMIRTIISDDKETIEVTGEILSLVNFVPLKMMTLKPDSHGEPCIAVIESDSERASNVIRENNRRSGLVVIVQLRSNGQFQIFPAGNDSVSIGQMDDIAKALRSEFIGHINRSMPLEERIKNDWRETCKEGHHPGTEEIFYFRSAKMIFNGSLTQPDVPGLVGDDPRKFPFNKRMLVDIIATVLEDNYWPKATRSACSQGQCPASTDKSYRCPIWHFGLYRCYKNRKGLSSNA